MGGIRSNHYATSLILLQVVFKYFDLLYTTMEFFEDVAKMIFCLFAVSVVSSLGNRLQLQYGGQTVTGCAQQEQKCGFP